MKSLQTVTAFIEAVAGLALLGLPSATGAVLLGVPLDQAAAAIMARIGGAAVLALAIACWLARRDADGQTSRRLVVAILFYNLTVAGVLAFASIGDGLHGVLLWPAVAFHAAMSVWCILTLLRNNPPVLR
jgi:hypothetical protein